MVSWISFANIALIAVVTYYANVGEIEGTKPPCQTQNDEVKENIKQAIYKISEAEGDIYRYSKQLPAGENKATIVQNMNKAGKIADEYDKYLMRENAKYAEFAEEAGYTEFKDDLKKINGEFKKELFKAARPSHGGILSNGYKFELKLFRGILSEERYRLEREINKEGNDNEKSRNLKVEYNFVVPALHFVNHLIDIGFERLPEPYNLASRHALPAREGALGLSPWAVESDNWADNWARSGGSKTERSGRGFGFGSRGSKTERSGRGFGWSSGW